MKKLYAIVNIKRKDLKSKIKYYETKKENYGVEIVRTVKNKVLSRKSIDNITSKERNIYKILDLITRQLITPETAEYIEDDLTI